MDVDENGIMIMTAGRLHFEVEYWRFDSFATEKDVKRANDTWTGYIPIMPIRYG